MYQGIYVMVLGYLMDQNLTMSREICLKTIKIQILNDNPYQEITWPLEVAEVNINN